MDIGIGLPALRPDPELSITAWARRAEERGFASLGTIDRLVYDNYEPFTALAVAAGATSRIRLTSGILLAPLRADHALFAKSVATLDRLSGGRLTLGLAPGGREDDYTVGGVDFRRRGKLLDALLERAVQQWEHPDDGVGPAPATRGGPPLLFGGNSEAALRRMTVHGVGWVGGASGVADFRAFLPTVRQAWQNAGRAGEPRLLGTANFALGPDAEQRIRDRILHYYAFAGEYAQRSLTAGLITPDQVAREVAAYAEAGCDELLLMPNGGGLEQVDLLADAIGL
ncbi:LLM class flavin-dependent oxidoreductase [Amycolatopsis taiwanensis]|uniref:LLM class flavin-dependent oxidoreductase n=1 Tax=Amycolatopsis taiwanensis TaxID=342230 RepID=UPI00048629B4|nr:LLM class flavin-dependent oxidoreductase [Amycolatopsis taiwanensis]